MNGEQYDEDYYLRGEETGKSLYTDYRWMPELTVPMVRSIIHHLGIRMGDRILDFGCARGYVVKAFRELGYHAYGVDISRWAIENADPEVYHHVTLLKDLAFHEGVMYEWVIAKDVLEHIKHVTSVVSDLMNIASRGVFAVVPLSGRDGGRYVIEEYEKDVTHCQRRTLSSWFKLFVRPGWCVSGRYCVPGIKDNWSQYPTGNGFITAWRVG